MQFKNYKSNKTGIILWLLFLSVIHSCAEPVLIEQTEWKQYWGLSIVILFLTLKIDEIYLDNPFDPIFCQTKWRDLFTDKKPWALFKFCYIQDMGDEIWDDFSKIEFFRKLTLLK